MKFSSYLFFIFSILPTFILAHSVEIKGSYTSQQYNQDLLYKGSGGDLQWWGGANYMRTKALSKTDQTFGLRTGLGWGKEWVFGGGIEYAITSREELQAFGPSIFTSYKYDYGVAFKKDDFVPYVKTSGGLGLDIWNQREVSLLQYSMAASLEWAMIEWLTAIGSYYHYFYSKDTASLFAHLDSPKVITKRYSSLSENVFGFSKNIIEGSLITHLFNKFHLELGGSVLKAQASGDWEQIGMIGAHYQVFKWMKVSAAFERYLSTPRQSLFWGGISLSMP